MAALAAMTPVLVLGASHQEEAVLSSVPPAYSLVLTDEERAWIAGHPTVTVGVLPDRRPLEYLEDGVLRGLSAEYLKEISQRTGLTFTFKPLR
ncbi:TPA: transporter substrate-binding domain-containing protein, partial [Pseudomonas aeruginosa]